MRQPPDGLAYGPVPRRLGCSRRRDETRCAPGGGKPFRVALTLHSSCIIAAKVTSGGCKRYTQHNISAGHPPIRLESRAPKVLISCVSLRSRGRPPVALALRSLTRQRLMIVSMRWAGTSMSDDDAVALD